MSTFILNITNDDDLIPFKCSSDYSTPLEILKYLIQISYLIPGLYLNFILFITIWFKQWETYTILSYFVIYSTDCFMSIPIIICDCIGRFIMYIPPLCPILSPYFFGPSTFFKGVMLVMNHSKTCKFIIQSLLVLNRMTCVMFPSTYAKSWRKWMKWLMALIFLTPLATDWNLVISRVYLQPEFGGFYFTRKVPWAKQSRFQLFFISIALFFTITCTSYTLHSLTTLPNRIKNAERTISIASAYVSIGYLILGAFQFFYAFFPYIDGGYLFQFAHLAYDVLNVGTPIIMICINKQFRQHAFGIKVPENPVAIPIFSMVQSRSFCKPPKQVMNISILIVLFLASTLSAKLTEDQQVCENNANRGRVLRKETTKMNLLEYDEQLETAAKKEKHSCPVHNVEKIKKDEMYSTSSYSQLMDHPYATKVACITVYCENKKTNSTVYVVDKGPSEASDTCPSGRTVDAQTGLCVASSASSRAFIGLFLIFSIGFI